MLNIWRFILKYPRKHLYIVTITPEIWGGLGDIPLLKIWEKWREVKRKIGRGLNFEKKGKGGQNFKNRRRGLKEKRGGNLKKIREAPGVKLK